MKEGHKKEVNHCKIDSETNASQHKNCFSDVLRKKSFIKNRIAIFLLIRKSTWTFFFLGWYIELLSVIFHSWCCTLSFKDVLLSIILNVCDCIYHLRINIGWWRRKNKIFPYNIMKQLHLSYNIIKIFFFLKVYNNFKWKVKQIRDLVATTI